MNNRTKAFFTQEGRKESKKKSKDIEVARFISEGNPNTQEIKDKDNLKSRPKS